MKLASIENDILDNHNVINERDPDGAIQVAERQYQQANYKPVVENSTNAVQPIKQIVIAGMGGSVLSPLLLSTWLQNEINIPIEIVNGYDLPAYVSESTLVIADSFSGNTEETVGAAGQALQKSAQVAITTAGGALQNLADENRLPHVKLPTDLPKHMVRMAFIYNFKALAALLVHYEILPTSKLDEITALADWLASESASWNSSVPTPENYAKQLALASAGKSAIFYGGHLTAPVAYKWKISWNETAKNIAFKSQYPEFDHNEIMSWVSHPVEKPFAIYDITSNLEHPQIIKRFNISDRVLSGYRPEAIKINLKGDSLLKQLFWGSMLADFSSIYLAILNGVNPNDTGIIEKLKKEL